MNASVRIEGGRKPSVDVFYAPTDATMYWWFVPWIWRGKQHS